MNKYGARRAESHNGLTFASKRERDRYEELKLLQYAGEISDLELQPRFPLAVNGVKVGAYVADFRYVEDGQVTVEDCKGYRTRAYRLKAKLVKALYGVEIRET